MTHRVERQGRQEEGSEVKVDITVGLETHTHRANSEQSTFVIPAALAVSHSGTGAHSVVVDLGHCSNASAVDGLHFPAV